jgi:putative transposase
MPRPFRLDFPGAFWHVHSRGVDRRDIFLDDTDRNLFLELLAETTLRFRWSIHSWSEMTNHYHLFFQTIEPTLSRGMQKLNGDFGRLFNRRHGRIGHLFQERFRAHLVDSEEYLLELARYVVLNPVRAGMVTDPSEWRWSSYRTTAGFCSAPDWFDPQVILRRFDPNDAINAQRRYREFVAAAIGKSSDLWSNLTANVYLGGKAFISKIEELTRARTAAAHDSQRQQLVRARTIEEVVQVIEELTGKSLVPKRWNNERERLAFVIVALLETTAGFTEIARILSLSPSGSRKLLQRGDRLADSDQELRRLIEAAKEALRSGGTRSRGE